MSEPVEQFPDKREQHVDHRTTTGAYKIVTSAFSPKHQKRYGRRKGDYPFWFFILDRWGFGAILAALCWLGLRFLAKKLGMDL
jgi:hypothetical protein